MIKYRVLKGARYVTNATILRGRNMAGIFLWPYRRRCRVVTVTGGAVTYDAGMIKSTILEIVTNSMAGSTIGSRGRVGWRWIVSLS